MQDVEAISSPRMCVWPCRHSGFLERKPCLQRIITLSAVFSAKPLPTYSEALTLDPEPPTTKLQAQSPKPETTDS